jgi:Predicted membrane protein
MIKRAKFRNDFALFCCFNGNEFSILMVQSNQKSEDTIMRKRFLQITVAIFMFVLLVGCSTNNTKNASDKLSSSKVLKNTIKVSADDAIKVYQKKYPKTDITSLELEKSFRGPVYKVEGIDELREYQVTINAKNKKIIQNSEEELDEEDQNETTRKNESLDLDKLISVKKAASIAENAAKGDSTEFNLEKDLGTTYWEVKVKNGSQEKEVKIDAQSGKVLKVESD